MLRFTWEDENMVFKPPIEVAFWTGYILSLFTAMIAGLEMSFNVYALPLKDTFNFTQTQGKWPLKNE